MKFHIRTYGCQMNVYDSEKIINSLKANNYSQTENYKDADVVLINTCSIREKASEKLYCDLGRITQHKNEQLKKHGRQTVVAVLGCVAQAEGGVVFQRSPLVDIVVGPQGYGNLGKMIQDAFINKKPQENLDFTTDKKFDFLREEAERSKTNNSAPSSFVTIQEGCDRFCTFCVVPYTRGPESSRRVEDIIQEVSILAQNGTKEIVLLGQNVNAFQGVDLGGRVWNIAKLISRIAEIEGVQRIKYTTSHPCYMQDELMALYAYEPKLSSVLNLPVQSGSDRILKKMNRKHTSAEYLRIIEKLRGYRPEMIFSSDFIVGFPTETEEDFQETLNLVKTVSFKSQSFSFKYSPRPGTPAADMPQVDEDIKSQRLQVLQKLLEEQRINFNSSFLGRRVEVLFDSLETKEECQIKGRTEFNQIVIVKNLNQQQRQSLLGKVMNCTVRKINNNSLVCEVNTSSEFS